MIGSMISEQTPSQNLVDAPIYRKDYVEIKVSAKLIVAYQENKEISIYDQYNKRIVPFAILVGKEAQGEQGQLLGAELTHNEYIISVHMDYVDKIIQSKNLKLLPFKTNLKSTTKTTKDTHEITI